MRKDRPDGHEPPATGFVFASAVGRFSRKGLSRSGRDPHLGASRSQVLTRTLKALERDGMVTRQVYPTVPSQVEYALPALGQSLSVPVMHLATWVVDHLDEIERHRDDHDRGRPEMA